MLDELPPVAIAIDELELDELAVAELDDVALDIVTIVEANAPVGATASSTPAARIPPSARRPMLPNCISEPSVVDAGGRAISPGVRPLALRPRLAPSLP